MRILFITPYPFDEAPSQRFRFEQYYGLLKEYGIEFDTRSFLDMHTWQILYKPGYRFGKPVGIIMGFVRRFFLLFSVSKYDRVFIHREAAPIGPPVFEWAIAKLLHKKIIYDFDDAIWLPNTSETNSIVAGFKWHGKVKHICRWAWKVSCGNDYLCEYARNYNANVILNPTTVDTEKYHNRIKDQDTEEVSLGWTGTHTTIPYLEPLAPILAQLEKQYAFRFIVISNREPDFFLNSLEYIHWQKEEEINDLLRFNIGIMPLADDPWARGKCGFKALQYMALGMPAIISPVGVNVKIIDNRINGYLCDTDEQWEQAIKELITNKQKRIEMGREARKKIVEHYSVVANAGNFLSLIT